MPSHPTIIRNVLGRTTGLLVFAALAALPVSARAETVTLESPALRLEVTTDPYSYRVHDKAKAALLLSQSSTTFTAVELVADGGAGPDAASDGGSSDATRDGGGDAAGDAGAGAPMPRPLRVLRAAVVTRGETAIELALTLEGTSDSARAKFSFTSPETLEVTLGFERQSTRRIREELEDRNERIYGIWEYPFDGNLDNRGIDEEYLGFGSQTGSLYTSARAPFFMSSRGYAVYARSSARGRFTVAVQGKTSFAFDQPRLTYTIIAGKNYYELLERYTAIAGGAFMPPLWAFGVMWWQDDFNRDLRSAANAQANVIDLASQLQTRRIPASSILIDRPFGTGTNGWGNMDWSPSFPDPPAMVNDLRARGLELVLWIANRAWNNLYTEGRAQGLLFSGSASLGPATDMRIPAAQTWWKGKLAPFVDLGVKGYKIDRGEQNEHPDSLQTENVTLYAKLAQETLALKHGQEGFVFARNVADTGRKHTAVWNGDSEANFTGLAYSIAAGLRSGLIAMPMWGSDTGGYLRSVASPNEEVFARWLGFSAYSPMMEVLVGDGHTPWYHYSEALVDIARKHAAAHHDLIPCTRSFVHAATRTGAPVMRPMLLEQPDEPALTNTWDQYLFGSELLVAPIVTAGSVSRAVYLPPGRWLDYNGRRQAVACGPAGGTTLAAAPLDTIPVFVREGAIVPRGRVLRANDNWTSGWTPRLRIEVFPAHQNLSRSFVYFTGERSETITAASEGSRLTVGLPALGLPGDLEVQAERVGRVLRNGTPLAEGRDYSFDQAAQVLRVPFETAATIVVEDVVSLFASAGAELPPPVPADGGVGRDGGSAGDGPRDAGVAPIGDDGEGCACRTGGTGKAPGSLAALSTLLGLGLMLRRRRGARSQRG